VEGAVRKGRGAGRRGAEAPAAEWEVLRDLAREADYFQVLGLSPDCSTSEVRDAWVRLSAHIEALRTREAGHLEALEALEEAALVGADAFEVLSDPDLRIRYRRALGPVGEEQGWPF